MFTFLGRVYNMINRYPKLKFFVIFGILACIFCEYKISSLYAENAPESMASVEYFIIPDTFLGLSKETTDVNVKNIVASKLPYLISDFDEMAEISDLARINMLVPLSIIYTVNSNYNEHNILNLHSGQLFPDEKRYKCDVRDSMHDNEFEQFLNVCDSIVTADSSNIAQYQALVMALAETRNGFDSHLQISQDLQNRSKNTNMATMVIQDVYSELKLQLFKLNSVDTKIASNNLKNTFIELSGKPLVIRNAQEIRQEKLTDTQVTELLNSRQIGWPWKFGESKCFNASHGAYDSTTDYSAMDIGRCDTWGTKPEEIFDVYTVDEGESIGFKKSFETPPCSAYKYIETTVGSNKIQYFYYHLKLTESEAQIGKKYGYQEKIGKTSNEIGANCGSGTGGNNGESHLHLGIYVNNQEITLDNVFIGGWKYAVVNSSADVYNGHYRYCAVEMQRGKDTRVAKDWSYYCGGERDRSVVNDFNRKFNPDQKFTLRQSNDETTNGRWPKLEWSYSGSTPVAYYLEVTKQEDTYWVNPVVYECIKPSSLLWWWQTNNYVPTSIDFQTERTGVFKWRVRSSDVLANDMNACRDANRGKWDKWSTEKTFTNRGLQTQYPGNSEKGFFQTFLSFDLSSIWSRQSRTMPTVQGYQLKIGQLGKINPIIVRCSNNSSITVPLNQMSSVSGMHWYTISVLTQPWTDNTCAQITGLYESYPRFFDNRIELAKNILWSPTNGYISSNGLWPELLWQTPQGADATFGYRIQVSRSQNFATTEVDECVQTASYLPKDNWWSQSRTGVFYWRVNYVPQAWSTQTQCKGYTNNVVTWSTTQTFVNPITEKKAQLIAPAMGFTSLDGLWPQLQWNPRVTSLGQYGYRIQVSKNRNFTGTLTVDECRTTNSYKPTLESWMRDPERNGEFFWRVNYLAQPWNGDSKTCQAVYVEPTLWSEWRTFVNRPPVNPVVLVTADALRTNNGLWPQLQWSNGTYMTTSNGYRIQISRDRTFGTTEVDQCTNDNFYVPQEAWWAAERTGVYYWRVNYMQKPWVGTISSSCKDATKINNQLWSVPRTFENPPVNVVPQLTAPAAGAQSPNGLWYQLQWNPGNATLATYGYRIQVSKNRNFTGTLTVDECHTTKGYQSTDENWMRAPERNGEFFWRINYVRSAWNNVQDVCKRQAVSATWSVVRSFKNAQPANPVVISAPANGAVTSDGSWPRIEWTNGAYMDHMATFGYRIQISRASNFSNPIVDECTPNRFYIPDGADGVWWMLDNQGQFYYRVNYVRSIWNGDKAACKQQTTDSRMWSESSRVFTNGVSNIKPQLVEPSDGMTSQDGLWPTLRWQPVRDALAQYGYRIQVSKSRAFTNNIVDECRADTSYRPQDENWMRADNQNGDLYWRINYVPKQWNGNQDACKRIPLYQDLWSGERKFVNKQASNPVVATSPSSGFTSTNGAWPRIEWTNGAYMGYIAKFGYRIQISTSSSFSSIIVDECLNSTSYSANNFWWEQSQKSTYYWRVNYMLRSWSGPNSDSCKDSSKINSALWSQWRTFTNPNDDRSTRASSPSSGHTTSDGLWPTISWSPYSSGYAEYGYRIQMSPNSDFSSLYVDECTNSTSYRPSGSSSEKFMRDKRDRIYWRINYMIKKWDSSTCKNSSGINNSWWSSSRYFNNPMPQNKVVLTSPSDGYTSSGGIWPTLQWSAGSNMSYYYPHGYYIEVSKNSSFTDLIVNQCTTTTSYKPADNWWMQTFRMRLYWRISYVPSAWNGNQNTCKSMSFSSSLRSNSRNFLNP